jgi:hypothetical protein
MLRFRIHITTKSAKLRRRSSRTRGSALRCQAAPYPILGETLSSKTVRPPNIRVTAPSPGSPICVSCSPGTSKSFFASGLGELSPFPRIHYGAEALSRKIILFEFSRIPPSHLKQTTSLSYHARKHAIVFCNRTDQRPDASSCFHSSARGRSNEIAWVRGSKMDDLASNQIGSGQLDSTQSSARLD